MWIATDVQSETFSADFASIFTAQTAFFFIINWCFGFTIVRIVLSLFLKRHWQYPFSALMMSSHLVVLTFSRQNSDSFDSCSSEGTTRAFIALWHFRCPLRKSQPPTMANCRAHDKQSFLQPSRVIRCIQHARDEIVERHKKENVASESHVAPRIKIHSSRKKATSAWTVQCWLTSNLLPFVNFKRIAGQLQESLRFELDFWRRRLCEKQALTLGAKKKSLLPLTADAVTALSLLTSSLLTLINGLKQDKMTGLDTVDW